MMQQSIYQVHANARHVGQAHMRMEQAILSALCVRLGTFAKKWRVVTALRVALVVLVQVILHACHAQTLRRTVTIAAAVSPSLDARILAVLDTLVLRA